MAISDSSVGLLFKLGADTGAARQDFTAFRNFILGEIRAIREESSNPPGGNGGGFLGLGSGAAAVAITIGAVATAATAAGKTIFDLAKSAAEFSDGLVDLNAKTNVTIETLSVIKHNAELAGTSIDAIGASLVIFQKNLAAASNGSKEMSARMKALGVDLKQGVEPNLLAVFEKLGKMEDGYKKTELAMSVFGRQGAAVLALLKQMDGDFAKATEEARRLGLVISTEDAKAADDFDDALKTLDKSVKGVTVQIGQGFIPELTRLIKNLSDAVAWVNDLTKAFGGLKAISPIVLRFAIQSPLISAYQIGKELGKLPGQGELYGPVIDTKGKGTKVPDFPGGGGKGGGRGGGGPKDITDAQLAVKLLKAEQDEAQRAYNGTREAAQRLLEVTLKLIDAETREANERLPNKAAARLAEVLQQRKKALEEYAEKLKEVSDDELKFMEDLSKRINEQNLESIEEHRQYDEYYQREQREAEADAYQRRAELQQQFSGSFYRNRKQAIANLAALDIDAEERRFERLQLDAEREMKYMAENDLRRKEITDRLDAEEAEKEARIALIRRQSILDQQREQPNSNLNLFGPNINDALNGLYAINAAAGQQTTIWQEIGVAMRAYVQDLQETLPNAMQLAVQSLQSVGDALAVSISAFIAGKTTLRQAIGALVEAMLAPFKEFALKKARIHFAAGIGEIAFGNYGAAAKHFLAGAAWVGVAGLIGAAGSLAAGSASAPAAATPGGGNTPQERGTRIIEQGDRRRAPAPQIIIIRAETEPGVVVRRVMEDYNNNGTSRQTLRRDMLGETAG